MLYSQRLRSLLVRLLRHRLFVLSLLIGAAYLFSSGTATARPPSPGKIPNGSLYYCGACHESGHTFSDGSLPVPSTPVHGNGMQGPFGSTTPIKTWTLDLANQDSDGDGFTNGEELQDPAGTWAIGKPDPGDVSFVSNPSDNNANNNMYECDLNYLATPPAPLLLDIIGYTDPANGDVTFGVSVRSPLPIDYVRYTVKKGSQTVHDFFSADAPFRSDAWNTKAVADGSYTITARVVELRAKAGETGRSATRTETFTVNNGSPTFGPVGEVVGTPANPCGISEALNGVAAVSANDIWAVGTRFINGPGEQMLIKHWDGVRWTSVISPNASAEFNRLSAAAAVSSNDVWAVGQYDPGSGVIQTLIQHWDGSVWKIVPSPNQGSSNNRLAGVAALNSSSAWAVGSADDGSGGSDPLILRWNGTIWQRISNLPVPANADVVTLKGVAVFSANNAWAVGSYRDGGAILEKTLIMNWNGVAWNIVPSPNPQSFQNALNAVTVVSAGDVWAVGYTSDGTGYKTLALHWNGTSWQKVNSPSPGSPNNELLGVAAVASSDVWAIGYANEGGDGSVYRTLALHWNGSSWQTAARPSDNDSQLNAIDALGSGETWAAGTDTSNSSASQTLIERYRVTRQVIQLPFVTVSATDASAAEAGPDSADFTITRTGATTQPLTVHYGVAGTATAGSDYPALSGQATIPASQASATVDVTPIDDTAVEGNETIVVTLSADSAYTLGANASATVTIADDDTLTQTVTISASDPSAAEHDADSGTFTITRNGSTTASLIVHYSVGGTATAGSDYLALSGQATIPAGQASTQIGVTPIDDTAVEGSETVVVTLSADSAYTIGTNASAIVTIADDDTLTPTITINASDPSAAEHGSDSGAFTITRSGSTTAPLAVHYSVGGTATGGGDYAPLPGLVTILAGQASATISLVPVDDAAVEGSETVIVILSADPAYILGASTSATVTIADNDPGQSPQHKLHLPFVRRS